MTPSEIQEHAETVRDALGILGPRPRESIVLLLQKLRLLDAEADAVIERGLFEVDPADPMLLRAVPPASEPGAPPAA